jgi:hypothetical protein
VFFRIIGVTETVDALNEDNWKQASFARQQERNVLAGRHLKKERVGRSAKYLQDQKNHKNHQNHSDPSDPSDRNTNNECQPMDFSERKIELKGAGSQQPEESDFDAFLSGDWTTDAGADGIAAGAVHDPDKDLVRYNQLPGAQGRIFFLFSSSIIVKECFKIKHSRHPLASSLKSVSR